MPTTVRTRLIGAPPERVFGIVSDPHHLPRWWPRVVRVEAVQGGRGEVGATWTTVLQTARGKPVRADHSCIRCEPPHAYAWDQEVEGTPFEGILRAAITTVEIEPEGDGAQVAITAERRLRSLARLGAVQIGRATGRALEEALASLEGIAVVGEVTL